MNTARRREMPAQAERPALFQAGGTAPRPGYPFQQLLPRRAAQPSLAIQVLSPEQVLAAPSHSWLAQVGDDAKQDCLDSCSAVGGSYGTVPRAHGGSMRMYVHDLSIMLIMVFVQRLVRTCSITRAYGGVVCTYM